VSRQPLKLEIDKEIARGRYSNVALISHTRNEFVFDFAFAYPQQAPSVASRVITSPEHAKAFLRSLEDNVRRYEARHGEIAQPPVDPRREENSN
jgi:hypothetical protein